MKGRVAVPSTGAAGFQTNYYINDEVDRLRATMWLKCDVCSSLNDPPSEPKRKASRVCCDCSIVLCKPCSNSHSSHWPSHTVQRICSSTPLAINAQQKLSLPDFSSYTQQKCLYLESCTDTQRKLPLLSNPDPVQPKCEVHTNEELRFYCQGNEGEACDMVICRDCRMTDHFHHSNVTDLSKMAKLAQQKLQKHEAEIRARIQALTSRKQTLESRKDIILTSKIQVETLLEARASSLISAITDQKDKTLALLDAQADEEDRKVMEEMGVTLGAQSSLEDMLTTVQQGAREGSDVDKVKVCADMDGLLEEGQQAVPGTERSKEAASTTKGFLLNTGGTVSDSLTEELLDQLLGKIVKL